LKRVVIEKLGPDGHSTLETSIDDALIVLADEIARGCMIFSRNNQQRIESEEELRGIEDCAEEPVRIMVIPPVAGG
jgi:hypothetical protein